MRKQSFLERLTGTETISDEELSADSKGAKPWSEAVDNHEHEETPELDYHEDAAYEDEEGDDEPGHAIDIYESDNELVFQSMIAGVTPENLHVSITRDVVVIRGKRNEPQGIPEEHYVTRELYWGTFSRTIDLPFEIDTDGAEAVEKYGLLIIRLPKLDTHKTAELKVKSI